MITRNNLRKLARETSVFLALWIAIIGGLILFNAYKQAEGFITEVHLASGNADATKILPAGWPIEQVHEDQWDIAYNFSPDCPASKFTSENFSALERAIEKSIRLWLEPLHELAKQRNKRLVDKFTFHSLKLQHLAGGWIAADKEAFRIKPQMSFAFICQPGNSSAQKLFPNTFLSTVQMRESFRGNRISSELPYSSGTLAHEIGHLFLLMDTYNTERNFITRLLNGKDNLDKTGGLDRTVGTQPPSIMSSSTVSAESEVRLTEDDKRGIRWLYRYVYDGNVDIQDCLNDDYVFEQLNDSVGGCVPRNPMAFEARQGHAFFIIRMLDEDPKIKDISDEDGYTTLHYLSISAEMSDAMRRYLRTDFDINVKNRHGDTPLHFAAVYDNQQGCEHLFADARIKVNALNTLNYTPLHYAARYGHLECVNDLLSHKDINPNLRNAAGLTPLQLAMQGDAGADADSDARFQALLAEKLLYNVPESPRRSPAELQQARTEIIALLRAHPEIILPEASDVNGDGVVNILDLVQVANAFNQRGQIPEDVNGDGVVNVQDLVWVSGAFGQ